MGFPLPNRDNYPPDFVAAIDHALVDVDTGANYRELNAIQNELKGLTVELLTQ